MPTSQRLPLRQAAPALVAIPARDEATEIGACLLALAAQTAHIDGVVLCLNNCRDGTADVARAYADRLPFPLHMIETTLPGASATAGCARRIAMHRAADIAGPDGVLLTTDADARVGPDWIAANLTAIATGAEAVAGRAAIEPEGARLIPAHLHAIDARECAYAALLDEICALVDPDPADPWPRHDEECGASIAVTVAAYRRAGGMPAVKLGEDRGFFAALRRVDARIRHADIAVMVSARTVGRAHGGMADTMRRRIERPDPFLDARLEPAIAALRRVRLRRALRDAWWQSLGHAAADHAEPSGLPASRLTELLATPHFGTAWAQIELESPVLRHRAQVPLQALAQQTTRARRIRDRLLRHAAGRADTPLRVAAE